MPITKSLHALKTIQGKFLLIVLPPVIVCFIIFSAILTIFTYQDRKQYILSKLDTYAETQATILAKPLWDINFDVAKAQVESMLLVSDISGAKVDEFTTGVVIQTGSLPGKHNFEDYFEVRTDIVYKAPTGNKAVGVLYLVSLKNQIFAPMIRLFLRDTLLLLLLIAAIVASAMVANKMTIGIPLQLFLKAIRRADKENIRKPVDWNARDELGSVIDAYNNLLDSLDKAEKELRTREERYRAVFEATGTATVIIEEDKTISLINSTFEKLSGYTRKEIENKRMWTEFVYEEDLERMVSYHQRRREKTYGVPDDYEFRFIDREGNILYIYNQVTLIPNTKKSIAAMTDITKIKQLETQLQQAQKMEAIGTLTGGIAHDFNNILGIIIGNTELALSDVHEGNPARRHLNEIIIAGFRARDIVQQLLSFSRKTDQELKPIALIPVIQDAIKFLKSTIPSTVEIQLNIQTSDHTILADPTQIHQIMMNLCTNAAQSMTPSGGELTVSLENVTLDADSVKAYPGLPGGRYINLSVKDTGPGIDPEIRDRIFDPYFTTKEVGKGSGMGLAVVHGIVKNHGGSIFVDSDIGVHTTFHIMFPLVSETPEHESKPLEESNTGEETILLIDDEESLLMLGKQLLERMGYMVKTEINPIAALERFRLYPELFDLVITDMTMPNMTGIKLAEEILSIRRTTPIILCTGFSETIDEKKAKEKGIGQYLEKPFDQRKLAMTVRKALDRI